MDFVRLSLKALSERRMRAALTIAGIAIGPLVLVMMSSVVGSYSNYIEERITSLGQNAIAIFPTENYRLDEEDLNYIRTIEAVKRVEPFYNTQGIVKRDTEDVRVSIFAVEYSLLFEAIGSLEVDEGVIPAETEISRAIIGRKIAYRDNERCFYIDDGISLTVPRIKEGKIIDRMSRYVIVGAILKEYGGALIVDPDSTIFVCLEAGKRLLGMDRWSGILVLADSPANVKPIVSILRQHYEDKAQIIAFSSIAEAVSSVTGAINFINFSTSLSAFAVAVAGVAATMITSVMERTREIGVMKAIGYTNGQILLLILMESIVMSLVGGAAGIFLGVVGAYILSSRGFTIGGIGEGITLQLNPLITPTLITQTLALTVLIGLAGGVLPAYRASRIPPVVALRYE
ncbi:ABC transporter permease [Candidatus Bathyarchaeota archaeon]|nr:ABC transporter permease [Candidatus Bathyarchaeota archaeon]